MIGLLYSALSRWVSPLMNSQCHIAHESIYCALACDLWIDKLLFATATSRYGELTLSSVTTRECSGHLLSDAAWDYLAEAKPSFRGWSFYALPAFEQAALLHRPCPLFKLF